MYERALSIGIVSSVLLSTFAGCVSSGPSVLDFSVRRITDGDRMRVLVDSESILSGMGFAPIKRDRDAGVLVYTDSGVPGGVRSRRLSSQMRRRRVVELRVQGWDDGFKVFCRVSIQRQTTQAYSALAFGGAGDDRPGQTAIDRDAATTTEQNTVWQTIKRDKSAERTILAAITGRINNVSSGLDN